MLHQPKFPVGQRRDTVGLIGPQFPRGQRNIGIVSGALLGLGQPAARKGKQLGSCQFELPLDSVESKTSSSDYPHESSGRDSDGESSEEVFRRPSLQKLVRWSARQERPIYMSCSEFEMGNNCFDVNNSGQGVDMQNLPSVADQIARQKTWMTLNFRYRMNWYEAKPVLSKMPRDVAYRPANLPLWTRCVRVSLHRKTNFLNGIRAFRNRMQCPTSGVRFTMYAFYREPEKGDLSDAKSTDSNDGPESKPLPFFKCPDDIPDLKTMVAAQLNVFISNSSSFFDQFWDDALKEMEV